MQEYKVTEEYVSQDDLEFDKKKGWQGKLEYFLSGKYFIPLIIVLISIIAFSLGRISGIQEKRPPVRIISENTEPAHLEKVSGGEVKVFSTTSESGSVVASKSGTKYHYPWCAGAKQISEKNKITFNTILEARTAGYLPATNCKGLK